MRAALLCAMPGRARVASAKTAAVVPASNVLRFTCCPPMWSRHRLAGDRPGEFFEVDKHQPAGRVGLTALGGFRTFLNGPEMHHRSSGQTGARAAAAEHGRGQAPPGSAGSRLSGRYPRGKCRRIMTGAVAV